MKTFAIIYGWLVIFAVHVCAMDWPQYRGSGGRGISTESLSWAGKPKAIWAAPTPLGFSSFAVAGGKAYTLVVAEVEGNPTEVCRAFDAKTGKVLWSAPLGFAKYDGGGASGARSNKGGDGCRSTPTINDGHVYVIDSKLNLYCFSAADGNKKWFHNLEKKYGARNIKWQNAASPLVVGDFVIVMGGGREQSFMAFNKTSGDLAWKSGSADMTHATPVVATIHEVLQVIFYTQDGLHALDVKTGKELWFQEFPFKVSSAASPVVDGDAVYVSAGYGVGAGAYKITRSGTGFESTEIWRNEGNKICNHWSTPVCVDGYLYGIFGFKEYGKAPLSCVELRTGEVKWEKKGFGPGNCVAVNGHLVVLSDRGEVVFVKTSPGKYQEVGRSKELSGKCWSTPAVSDGKVYVRSTKEGKCLQF